MIEPRGERVPNAAPRAGLPLGLGAALLIASGVAGLAAWLLFLPARAPARLVPPRPRPELLDKPHRHRAAAEPSPGHSLP